MRRVHLSMVNSDMYLASPVLHDGRLFLAKGTKGLDRFAENLSKLGIEYLYVEDKICDGIEIPDAITEMTRSKCKKVMHKTLNRIKSTGVIEEGPLFESVDNLIDEIINRPDILISLNDIGSNDDSTLAHSINTTVYALLLGKKLGYNSQYMKWLAEGVVLHDVGKILLDQKILYKPSKLNEKEFEHIKQHPVLGYKLLKTNPILTELSRMVCLCHHERLDGSGYPQGLKKNEIHDFSKIAAIVDIYDALISDRCYHDALSTYDAINILMRNSADQLDAGMTGLFIQHFAIYPNGSTVGLSDGTYAIIKEQNENMPMRPIVRVFDPWEQVPLYEVDLMKELSLTITNPQVVKFFNKK